MDSHLHGIISRAVTEAAALNWLESVGLESGAWKASQHRVLHSCMDTMSAHVQLPMLPGSLKGKGLRSGKGKGKSRGV